MKHEEFETIEVLVSADCKSRSATLDKLFNSSVFIYSAISNNFMVNRKEINIKLVKTQLLWQIVGRADGL